MVNNIKKIIYVFCIGKEGRVDYSCGWGPAIIPTTSDRDIYFAKYYAGGGWG